MAFRMPGPRLTLTKRNLVVDHQGPKPRRYSGCLADYVAIDWQVIKQSDWPAYIAKLIQQAEEQRAAAMAANAAASGETR